MNCALRLPHSSCQRAMQATVIRTPEVTATRCDWTAAGLSAAMARKRESSAEDEMTSCEVGALPASLISFGGNSRSRKEKRTLREPDMSQKERELWRDMIWRRSGLFFPDTRIRF